MSDLAIDLLHGLAALAALSALILAAALWLRAGRPLRRGGSTERFLDGTLLLCWLGVVFFFLLAGLGAFRVWIAAAVLLIGGLITGRIVSALTLRRGYRSQGSHQYPAPAEVTLQRPELGDPFLWAALPVAAIALVRLIKGMVAPPMAWDAMTVHLPKAAFWIQSGSLALPDFPDAWTYYRWFPAGGEILFAWVMLPFRGDLLLGPFGFVVWLAIWMAGARLARLLGAPSRNAWLAGGALAALPTALVFMTANYVDNLVVLFALLAITHALLFVRDPELRNGVLCLAAIGLAISIKTSSVLLAVPLVVAIAVASWRHRTRLGGGALPAFTAALSLPCVGYLWTWIATGSPFYPIRAPGLELPFHLELAKLFSGEAFAPAVLANPGWPGFLRLFWSVSGAGEAGGAVSDSLGYGHLNFGLGGAILAAAALVGLLLSLGRVDRRFSIILCLAGAAMTTPLVLSSDHLALRTVWIGVLGRHLLPAYAPLALCAALLPGRSARLALGASLLASGLHFFPLGWSASMTEPALYLFGALLVAALTIYALRKFTAEPLRARTRLGLSALVTVVFLSAWGTIRAQARYPIYRDATPALGAFDAHPPHPAFAMAASLWPMLDTPEDKLIALSVGRDQIGHNQFFYPLLGSRLQNRLVHLPTSTATNELEMSARERYSRAEPDAWLSNLEAASIDLVVGLWQPTPERDWLARERSFEVVALTDLGVPWIGRRLSEPRPEARPEPRAEPPSEPGK